MHYFHNSASHALGTQKVAGPTYFDLQLIAKFPIHVSCEVLDIAPQHSVIGSSSNFRLQEPVQTLFLPKYVHIKILEHLLVCESVVGGRAAMQCDCLVMVLPGSLYFHRLQTTLLRIDFAHTPS